MGRISSEEYRRLPLRGHELLEGVPIVDAWRLDLDGGAPDLTMVDFDRLLFGNGTIEAGRLAGALFRFRMLLGRVFGWDRPVEGAQRPSLVDRLTDDDRRRSLVEPGTVRGIRRVVYVFEDESLAEVRNRTVDAYIHTAVRRRGGGTTLYLGILVRKISWFTPVYMAMIAPFRRWIIYPAMLEGARRRWERESSPGAHQR